MKSWYKFYIEREKVNMYLLLHLRAIVLFSKTFRSLLWSACFRCSGPWFPASGVQRSEAPCALGYEWQGRNWDLLGRHLLRTHDVPGPGPGISQSWVGMWR